MDSNPSCGIRVLEKILAVPSIGEHENKSAAWERWNKKQAMQFTWTALNIRRTVNRKAVSVAIHWAQKVHKVRLVISKSNHIFSLTVCVSSLVVAIAFTNTNEALDELVSGPPAFKSSFPLHGLLRILLVWALPVLNVFAAAGVHEGLQLPPLRQPGDAEQAEDRPQAVLGREGPAADPLHPLLSHHRRLDSSEEVSALLASFYAAYGCLWLSIEGQWMKRELTL